MEIFLSRFRKAWYLYCVRRKLRFPFGEKNLTIKKLREFIDGCLENGDIAGSMQDFYRLFGTPEELAQKYDDMRTEADETRYRREKLIKRMVFIVFCSIITLALIVSVSIRLVNAGNKVKFRRVTTNTAISYYDTGVSK